ncbi:DUF3515 family protein [Microbacterium sp.]|uniref:DUF3515 family protein n=1 Tax=Microbacterium sp. TaxID=51671 RepID=UPI002E32D92F|nr:DUF3515 family protein [Microbacterium sp.]HEX5728807.1 DUF3515 family protein [Microbacterium sp.]
MPRRSAVLAAAWVLAMGAFLAGCSSTVALQPAEDADDPGCADVTVRLPGTVDGESRRWTDAQATGAWGDPASVILTCGVTPPGPTTLPCQSVNGVDWIIDDAEAPRYRVTTFGRTPAVEIYLDNDVVSSAAVLDTLSQVVSVLPSDGSECTDAAST